MDPRVIYITGQAFSGSTFLAALLGTHPDIEPVSELAKWTKGYLRRHERLCACGKTASECEFWTAVEGQWVSATRPKALPKYVQLQDKFEHISSIWINRLAKDPHPTSEFAEYQVLTEALFRSIMHVSNRSMIVDSSKLPGRALAISRMHGLDVSVIHLVRDGNQFLRSSVRRGRLAAGPGPNLLYKTFALGLSWSITNLAAEYVLSASRRNSLRVRYEDLVSDPIRTIMEIGSKVGLDTSSIQKVLEQNQPIPYRHMASGSHHRTLGAKTVIAEHEQGPEIGRRQILAFRLGAAAVSSRYGYSWRKPG